MYCEKHDNDPSYPYCTICESEKEETDEARLIRIMERCLDKNGL